MPRCPHCGERAYLDVLEVWPEERAFQFDTCCEEAYWEQLEEAREWGREAWARFFQTRAGLQVRRVLPGSDRCATSTWPIDFGLEVREIEQQTARDFIARHHRHHGPPAGWKLGRGAWNGHELVAVAWAGRPVSRMLDDGQVLEVARLCVDHDTEPGLVWNACSQLYAAVARAARALGYRRLITYTLATEGGESLKASGFTKVYASRGGSWSRPSRPREEKAPTMAKVRWERALDGRPGPWWGPARADQRQLFG